MTEPAGLPAPSTDAPTHETRPAPRRWLVPAMFALVLAVLVAVPLGIAVIALRDKPQESESLFDYTAGAEREAPLAPGSGGYVAAPPDGSQTAFVTLVTILDDVTAGLPLPRDGHRWVAFEVAVESDGIDALPELTWGLATTTGAHFERSTPPVSGPAGNLSYPPLEPGETARGWVYFEIPRDAGFRRLTVQAGPFGGQPLDFVAP